MDRCIEEIEGPALNDVANFRADARKGPSFFYNHEAIGFLHAFDDGVVIDRANGSQIDQFRTDAIFGQFSNCIVAAKHHFTEAHDGHIGSGGYHIGFANGDQIFF